MDITSKYTDIDGEKLVNSGYLTNLVASMLNGEASMQKKDLTFTLYDGYGELTKAVRAGNYVERVIPGIASTQRGQRENINGLDMHSATTNVELIVPVCRDGIHEDKYFLHTVRDVCNAAALRYNSAVYHDESISYSVSIAATGAVIGDHTPDVSFASGEYISVLFSVGFGIFANGVNGSDVTLKVNGMELHKNALVKTRAKSAESVQNQGGRHTREVILQDGMSFDLTGPLTDDAVGHWLMEEIDGEHDLNAPLVVYERKRCAGGDVEKAYLMTAANSSYTAEPNINGGYSLSLVEILFDSALEALSSGESIPGVLLTSVDKVNRSLTLPSGNVAQIQPTQNAHNDTLALNLSGAKIGKLAVFVEDKRGDFRAAVCDVSRVDVGTDIEVSLNTPLIIAVLEEGVS